ncbi:MAG: Gfo/Idh/MocA family oxidoreductase [Bryobacteraceae bacterium]
MQRPPEASTSQLRIAIIGCGWATRNLHLPAFGRTAAFRVVAAADPSPRLRSLPGLSASATFAAWPDMLRETECDAVLIASPPAGHAAAAIASLEAGHHVLVEKPVAVNLDDARRMAAAATTAQRVLATGFNQRCHPAFIRLRHRIASGDLGALESIHVRWSTGAGLGARPWIGDRALGGGALFDLGSHIVDLWRFLTSQEIAELRAESRSLVIDDETAVLDARLEGGVRCRAELSLVDDDEFSVTIAAASGHETIRPYGRAFARGYDEQWRSFAAAIRGQGSPRGSIADGIRSLELISRAAEPLPVCKRETPLASAYPFSAICATPTGYRDIRATVTCLRRQTIAPEIELVLIGPDIACLAAPPEELEGFAHVELVAIGAAAESKAHANAAGVRHARGRIVALTEDHCFPDPDWAAALLHAHAADCSVVGPAVRNGNPGTAISQADFLIGYGPWMEPAAAGERPFLPGHNSSYKREELLALGGRLDRLFESETVLHMDWSAQGRSLLLEPAARVRHINFSLWRTWIPVQVLAGRVFAGARAAAWPRWKRWFYAAASPLIPAVRLWRSVRTCLGEGRPRRALLHAGPALVIGLVLDGFGQFLGYLFGQGDSANRLAPFEYNRVNHVRPEERGLWTSP